MDDGFALMGQSLRLFVGEAAALSQAARNVLVLVELREILRGGDDGDLPIQASRGLADGDQLDAIGNGGQLVKIIARFIVIGQIEIVAGFMAEDGFGSRDGLRGRGG